MLLLALLLETEDADLMRRIANGDEEAFRILYDKYLDAVYSMALKVMRDPVAAEDVTQEIFLKLWQRASQFQAQRGKLLSWLLTMTRNYAIDRLRYQNRRPVMEAELNLSRHEHDERTLWDLREEDALRLSLDILPPEQRRCIELAFFYGMSHRDIAETLKMPLGTVKSRIRLGLRKLRDIYLKDTHSSTEGRTNV